MPPEFSENCYFFTSRGHRNCSPTTAVESLKIVANIPHFAYTKLPCIAIFESQDLPKLKHDILKNFFIAKQQKIAPNRLIISPFKFTP